MKLHDVPPELIAEIATGLEAAEVIASRYGIEGQRWEALQSWKPFRDAVDAQRAEFEKSGVTFRIKAALKANTLADRVFVKALHPDTPLPQQMEAVKLFARLGDLEPQPKAVAAGASGPSFSITIDLGNAGQAKAVTVSTTTKGQQGSEEEVIDVAATEKTADDAPKTLVGIQPADFDLGPRAIAATTPSPVPTP